MYRFALFFLFFLIGHESLAQSGDDWNRLHQYAQDVGVDSLCDRPNADCLNRYFTEVVYGHPPRYVSYRGVPERIDTVSIVRLTHQFLAGADWCSLLDSLESSDPNYRQLKAYCMRCLADDYMVDSLTIEQIQETLNTYRWLNRFEGDKRVVVNIPSATLRVIDGQGQTLLSSRIVVGKPSTPTPRFTAFVPSVVMYPYWNVPRSIATKELFPKIRQNPAPTLDAMNLQLIDARGRVVDPNTVDWSVSTRAFPYRLRQSTGCDNALGVLKFNVTDPYDVYLHDTNFRAAFTRENRYLSHGCIRVEKPTELANLLLGFERFDAAFLTTCPVYARPKTVMLPKPVPVIITYNVLDIDEAGAIEVYKDVYRFWTLK